MMMILAASCRTSLMLCPERAPINLEIDLETLETFQMMMFFSGEYGNEFDNVVREAADDELPTHFGTEFDAPFIAAAATASDQEKPDEGNEANSKFERLPQNRFRKVFSKFAPTVWGQPPANYQGRKAYETERSLKSQHADVREYPSPGDAEASATSGAAAGQVQPQQRSLALPEDSGETYTKRGAKHMAQVAGDSQDPSGDKARDAFQDR